MKVLKSTALVLLILGSLVWLYINLRPDKINLDPYDNLGESAADETAKLLGKSGRLVLVDADFGIYKLLAPTTQAQIKSFRKAIKRTNLEIVAVEKVKITPPSMSRMGIFMQPGQISDLMARYSNADAIVLFVGLAGPEDFKGIVSSSGKPRLVLVSNYESNDKSLLRNQVIQLAIVARLNSGEDYGKAIRSRKQWFEQNFLVVTPERIAELAD